MNGLTNRFGNPVSQASMLLRGLLDHPGNILLYMPAPVHTKAHVIALLFTQDEVLLDVSSLAGYHT